MRRICVLVIVALGFLVGRAYAQAIQEYPVTDLSGGLVNSIDNALMQDNQALVLGNYDIDDFGLRRRKGFSLYNNDANSNLPTQGVIPYQAKYIEKDLLVLRSFAGYYPTGFDVADTNIMLLMKCAESESACSAFVYKPFFVGRRNVTTPYNITSQVFNSRLLIAVTNSELVVYDGNKAFPARPLMAGQPRVTAIDGGGNVSGIVRYRLAFKENSRGLSDMGVPSWEVKVKEGTVFLSNLGPVTISTLQDSGVVYRSLGGGSYEELVRYSTITGGNGVSVLGTFAYYMDTTSATAPADTTAYPWGIHTNCLFGACSAIDSVPAPGEMSLIYARTAATQHGVTWSIDGLTDTTCAAIAYSIVYLDSAGRESYASPPACLGLDLTTLRAAGGNQAICSLFNIPVPSDSGVSKKLLLRALVGNITWADTSIEKLSKVNVDWIANKRFYGLSINGISVYWGAPTSGTDGPMIADSVTFYLNADTDMARIIIAEDSTTFIHLRSAEAGVGWTHTKRPLNLHTGLPGDEIVKQQAFAASDYLYNYIVLDTLDDSTAVYVDSMPYDSLTIITWCEDSSSAQEPTSFCYDDSAISFQPFDIAFHGERLFAIGDLTDKNALWYSDFGRPTTYAPDHFFSVESQFGDWFVRLLSVGDNLLLFRQNSIYALSGLSFFQFQLNQVVAGVGLTAPRSLAHSRNVTFFGHESGVYTFPMQPNARPLSWPIQNTIDSIGESMRRAIGRIVGEEYWFSAGIGVDSNENNQTLIYSNNPKPHWKSYSFGIRDMVPFDEDTLALDYASNKFIFVGQSDSMYRWNYSSTDTLDDTTHIIGKYQSKYFFHEGKAPKRREKIFYVDIFGTGTADTLVTYFYEETGGLKDSVTIVPDFTDNIVDRVVFNRISDNFSFGWRDNGQGDYRISGYTIGMSPWDEGRKK